MCLFCVTTLYYIVYTYDIIYRICFILWLILCAMGIAFFGQHSSVVIPLCSCTRVQVSDCMLALNKGRSALMRGSCFHGCQDGRNPAARVVFHRCNWGYARREAARRCTGKRGEAMALQVWKKWSLVGDLYLDFWTNKRMEKLCRLFGIGLIFAILVVEIRWALAPCFSSHVAQASSACSDPMIGQKEIHARQGTHTHTQKTR